MPRKAKLIYGNAGALAILLKTARVKSGTPTHKCSAACGLSTGYLTRIELGQRSPELERMPAIAKAYGVDVSEACWTWIAQYAPASIPFLAAPRSPNAIQ
jgi:transcriptional regulator with XRE-family HTH domain